MTTMSVGEALALLGKLRQAAPRPTADRLAQAAALIETLAQENAYLNALVGENTALLAGDGDAEPENLPQTVILTSDDDDHDTDSQTDVDDAPVVEHSTALGLLIGVNDALRAPLVAIRGRAELVQAGALGGITDEQQHWVNAIFENTDRAFRLLDTVQAIVSLQRGQVKIEHANFISTDLIEEAHKRMARAAAESRHRLLVVIPQTVPLATGDFYQSLIVLLDLLDNAIRYTPSGGDIRLSVDSLGTHVLFSVADSGIGLSADDLPNVGRPFWRGDRHPVVRQHTGTGLRLFLARQILALQDGELIFSGEPGVGSTFSFTLPSPG